VFALRGSFGPAADQIVVANTKGFTGHAMGAGIEDVVAIKALETGIVPPVANFKEVDPELGLLNLSKGGAYPGRVRPAPRRRLRLADRHDLYRHVPTPDGHRPAADQLGYTTRVADPAVFQAWVTRMSGYASADLEVVNRTLRVKDPGPGAADGPADATGPPRPFAAAAQGALAPTAAAARGPGPPNPSQRRRHHRQRPCPP